MTHNSFPVCSRSASFDAFGCRPIKVNGVSHHRSCPPHPSLHDHSTLHSLSPSLSPLKQLSGRFLWPGQILCIVLCEPACFTHLAFLRPVVMTSCLGSQFGLWQQVDVIWETLSSAEDADTSQELSLRDYESVKNQWDSCRFPQRQRPSLLSLEAARCKR